MNASILAIDTSSQACSVALSVGDQVFVRHTRQPRKHAELVLPMVQELLVQADCQLAELDAVALGRGPGSFTGLRIAAGITQGLAFGAGLPVVAVSSLAVIAHRAWRELGWSQSHVLVDARMNEVYWGAFRVSAGGEYSCLGREWLGRPETLDLETSLLGNGDWYGVGSGWSYDSKLTAIKPMLQAINETLEPHALDLLALAQRDYAVGHTIMANQVAPVYLRDNVAAKPAARS